MHSNSSALSKENNMKQKLVFVIIIFTILVTAIPASASHGRCSGKNVVAAANRVFSAVRKNPDKSLGKLSAAGRAAANDGNLRDAKRFYHAATLIRAAKRTNGNSAFNYLYAYYLTRKATLHIRRTACGGR